ncbi:MAG: ribbon-helix-helix domain-containing protein [Nanoarchaeota archaeon]
MINKSTAKSKRITITIDKELLNWLDDKVKKKVFANRSHGLEFLKKQWSIYERENYNYFG